MGSQTVSRIRHGRCSLRRKDMKSKLSFFAPLMLAVALLMPSHSSGQQQTRYKLLDLGTLGGPHSFGSVNGDGFQLLNNSGNRAAGPLASPVSAHTTTPKGWQVLRCSPNGGVPVAHRPDHFALPHPGKTWRRWNGCGVQGTGHQP